MLQSVGVLCNVLIALGVFNAPYLFRIGGGLTLVALAVPGFIAVRNGFLINKSIQLAATMAREEGFSVPSECQDWGSLAASAYGSRGETVARVCFVGELSSYTVSFLTTIGNLAHHILPLLSIKCWTVVAIVLSTVLSTLSMKFLSYASLLAHVSYAIVFLGLIFTGWENLTADGAEDISDIWNDRLEAMALTSEQLPALPTAFSVFVFCLAGHSVMPTVYSAMADKTRFKQVIMTSYAAAITVYLLVGLSGYFIFGDHTAQVITVNLATDMKTGQDLHHYAWMRTGATLGVIIKLLLCIPLFLNPVTATLEEMMQFKERTRMLLDRSPQEMKQQYRGFSRLLTALWRFAFVAVLGGLGILFQDKVALAVSLVGATFGTALVFVLPITVYVGLARRAGQSFTFCEGMELTVSLLIGVSSGLFAASRCMAQLLTAD